MKNPLLTLAASLLLAAPAFAQNLTPAQVPAAVVTTFHQTFSQATAVRWEREHGGYEAGFRQGRTVMSAVFDAAGALQETETGMAPGALPAPVRHTLATRYKGIKVSEVAKIVAAKTGAVTYEAEVREHGRARDVLFTADGREVRGK